MKLAIHGYGQMGRAIERIAAERGHDVVSVIDAASPRELHGADVLIDFSHAAALDDALQLATANHVDLVIGTTGWSERIDDVRRRIDEAGIGAVYASNFSVGANLLFALARRAGELFAPFPQYECGLEERHHSRKKDAPSGTALRIAADVRDGSAGHFDPACASSRVGAEFGLHTLFFDSPDDLIELSHRARGRDGFARGAVVAAERIHGKRGLLRFEELLDT
jgi:4-hydroxy-tetrahydrodipicolinate reductase